MFLDLTYSRLRFMSPDSAKDALEKMNGFDLAGRPIRVGLGNDKFTTETTERVLQKFPQRGQPQAGQPSSVFGAGGRGTHAGGSGNFDRPGGRDKDKGASGASALDDGDVFGGIAMSNNKRHEIMEKLARRDQPAPTNGAANVKTPILTAPPRREAPPNVPQASRCIKIHNVFDAAE